MQQDTSCHRGEKAEIWAVASNREFSGGNSVGCRVTIESNGVTAVREDILSLLRVDCPASTLHIYISRQPTFRRNAGAGTGSGQKWKRILHQPLSRDGRRQSRTATSECIHVPVSFRRATSCRRQRHLTGSAKPDHAGEACRGRTFAPPGGDQSTFARAADVSRVSLQDRQHHLLAVRAYLHVRNVCTECEGLHQMSQSHPRYSTCLCR